MLASMLRGLSWPAIRTTLLCSGIAIVTVATVGLATPAAQATPAAAPRIPAAPVLPVNLSTAGFVLPGPNPRPGGVVTFQVSTVDARGHYWSTFKLRNGVTLAQVGQWFADGENPDHTIAFPALHNLYTNVQFTGGVAVFPSTPVGLTMNLTQGTYYITDTLGFQAPSSSQAAIRTLGAAVRPQAAPAAAGDPAPSPFAMLEVTSTSQRALPPAFSAVIEAVQHDGHAVLVPVGRFRAQGSFLFRNDAVLPQEATFLAVAPGVTDQDVSNYYAAIFRGDFTVPSPFVPGPSGGELIISPGEMVIVSLAFTPGRYVALSFPTNWDTGVKQAYEGVHVVVDMH
jgi:hypothetical protein